MGSQALTASLNEDGFFHIKIAGELSVAFIAALRQDVETAKKAVEQASIQQGHKVRALLDLTEFSGVYSPEAIMILADYEKFNSGFILKTAAYGASENVRLVGNIVSLFAHRENIEFFNSREEAINWLNA